MAPNGIEPFYLQARLGRWTTRRETSPSLDDLASPVFLNCVECSVSMILTNRATLRCSDVRHQTLKLIHTGVWSLPVAGLSEIQLLRTSRGAGAIAVTAGRASAPGLEVRRALVLHDWPWSSTSSR